jgi:glutamine amidotransferase PdxT
VVVQVRTTTDLDRCDALIIPGGGMSAIHSVRVIACIENYSRVDDYCITSALVGSP